LGPMPLNFKGNWRKARGEEAQGLKNVRETLGNPKKKTDFEEKKVFHNYYGVNLLPRVSEKK